MTSDRTPRLNLPMLHAGQAQKEMTHNEALALLDLAIQPVVQDIGVAVPPETPVAGQAWIVGAAPQGDWAGQPHAIAGWTGGGWRFLPAFDGMVAHVAAQRIFVRFHDNEWVRENFLGMVAEPVPAPAGGTIIDAEARSALTGVLIALGKAGLIATE